MSMLPVQQVEVLTEVGAAELVDMYSFVDPLWRKVDITERVDLGQHPRCDGKITFLPMPKIWDEIPDFKNMFDFKNRNHELFYETAHSWGIYTVLYSYETLVALEALAEWAGPEYVIDIADELFPTDENEFLARKHGSQSMYVDGCRGPLCKLGNTFAHRKRYNQPPPTNDRLRVSQEMTGQIIKSYQAYLEYLNQIIRHRRTLDRQNKKGPYWRDINRRLTLLMDVTDESKNLEY